MSLARNFERNRPGFRNGNGRGKKPVATVAHAEDSQPNESIDKRRGAPALVVPSKAKPPPPRPADARWGFRGKGWRGGRGGSFTPNHTTRNSARPDVQSFTPPPARNSGSSAGPVDAGRRVPYVASVASKARPIPIPILPPSSARPASTSLVYPSSSAPAPLNAPPLAQARHASPIHIPEQPIPIPPRDLALPPPVKRRRVEPIVKVEETPILLPPRPPSPPIEPPLPARAATPPVRIKLEPRTPSPPPEPSRRSATSGSKRCFPVPASCTRANPDFAAARRKWARGECTVLRDLGLKVEKYFFRDDGMVIEWISDEPVWLDTLRPVQERPRLAVPAEQEIIDVDADDPAPSPQPISPIAGPSTILSADERVPTPAAEEEAIPLTVEEEQAQMEELSLTFIRRYILTFDRDRDSLASAYSEDAIFSFRDNNFPCPTHFTFQRARPSSNSAQSKSTMPKLPALRNYRFAGRAGEINLDYEVVALERGGLDPHNVKVVLSVHGQLVAPDERTLAIDQTFVLRRNAEGAWPLVATSHLMVVRDTPWVRWGGTLEGLGIGIGGTAEGAVYPTV
ncbi:hypothetical protein DFH06DRAFT_128689 [Mycena polygramma]|nr:hypothetical protein DFH06DRAFT_128689 [Mycena polygramma]